MNRLLALLPLLLAPLVACAPPAASLEGSADIAVSAQALSTSDVAKVTLTVSASDISPSLVTDLQNTAGQWRAVIGAIPSGSNRTFLAQAFDSSNNKLYEGQATGVTISSAITASVVILLQQTTAPSPFVNSAPKVTGLSSSTDHVDFNESLSLTVSALDADSDTLSYAWSATGGSFANANTATPTWTAPATEGTYTLSVSVTDGKGGQAGISLKVAVVHARSTANVSVAFNAWPVASQVKGTPFGQVALGGTVNLDVAAVDADNDPLTYAWSDNCSGSFSDTTVKSPTWTAPASAAQNSVCTLTVSLSDGRGGSTKGLLGINLGLPQVATAPPILDQLFQSIDSVAVNGTVNLSASAHDPEGAAVTFTWSTNYGTLGTATTTASQSQVVWKAPALAVASTITLEVKDAGGTKTTQTFPVTVTGGPAMQSCIKTVTSYVKEANPFAAPITVTYSMVGGGGGGSGYSWSGTNGTTASGSFSLGNGTLEVFVGGGGGWGFYYSGGSGGGAAGYYGGGGGGTWINGGGCGGGGGSSAILNVGQLVAAAAGGHGSFSGGGGGSTVGGSAGADANGATTPTAGTFGAGGNTAYANGGNGLSGGTSSTANSGGGGGYGGGGGVSGGAGGSAGANAVNSGGLGANTWSTATSLPTEAGAGSTGGGNAGLVILTYSAPSCSL